MKYSVNLKNKTISIISNEKEFKIASLKKSKRRSSIKKSVRINYNKIEIVNNVNINKELNETLNSNKNVKNVKTIIAYGTFTILIIFSICFGASYLLNDIKNAGKELLREYTYLFDGKEYLKLIIFGIVGNLPGARRHK